jgi:hypothetical protein
MPCYENERYRSGKKQKIIKLAESAAAATIGI